MKYKLINIKTKEEHLCDRATIDGFDYYVSDEKIKDVRPHKGKWHIEKDYILNKFPTYLTDLSECRIIIATTNPKIDIPKVVDEVAFCQALREFPYTDEGSLEDCIDDTKRRIFVKGYNKSQETHPFSEEDMIDFKEWCDKEKNKGLFNLKNFESATTKELFQIWKKQQPKVLFYE